ncbi:MAG: hypothetical protein HYV63_26310 [Candidatus Schekmanbacteria bacterium]|nr:hypothetical protein [Candidatus Schekmanbacteria bacterium]
MLKDLNHHKEAVEGGVKSPKYVTRLLEAYKVMNMEVNLDKATSSKVQGSATKAGDIEKELEDASKVLYAIRRNNEPYKDKSKQEKEAAASAALDNLTGSLASKVDEIGIIVNTAVRSAKGKAQSGGA